MFYASLPMYHFNFNSHDCHLWWQQVALRLSIAQENMCWNSMPSDLMEHWNDQQLLLSQTCGFPLVKFLQKNVQLIGTLHYSAEGCSKADYSSAFIVNKNDQRDALKAFKQGRFVCNSRDSQSGFNAIRLALLQQGLIKHVLEDFFADVMESGAHLRSVELVAASQAEIASIDCVSLALLKTHRPSLYNQVRVIGYSDLFPGLPLVTSLQNDQKIVQDLRQAVVNVVQDPKCRNLNKRLLISGFSVLDVNVYNQRIILPD